VTFVRETDDFSPSEPDNKDRGLEQPYPPPDESQPTLPEAVESVPTDVLSNDSPSHTPTDVSIPSLREAYLIRSYIQKIAAVVSFLPTTDMESGLTAAGGYL
jgi:hypothetical protein